MRTILMIILVLLLTIDCKSQYKSLDFEINVTSVGDDYLDRDYEYDAYNGPLMTQWCLGYTFTVGNKLTLSPRIAYAYSLETYFKRQRTTTGGSLSDQTYIEKDNQVNFLKTGTALSYWIFETGKGVFLESEVQGVYRISGKSRIRKRVGAGEIEDVTIDYKDQVNGFVPSLRFSVGYNLHIKRVSCFFKISRELRFSTYYRSAEDYSLLSPSIGLGVSYLISKNQDVN